jgi:hypothetical protein
MSEGTFNPADRRLCPDGSCIGVIGPDGRCRACGRAGDGSAPIGAAAPSWDDDGGDDDSLAADGAAAAPDAETGGFRPDRRLCDDGSCVGVIGAGDVCTVCGRPAGS